MKKCNLEQFFSLEFRIIIFHIKCTIFCEIFFDFCVTVGNKEIQIHRTVFFYFLDIISTLEIELYLVKR